MRYSSYYNNEEEEITPREFILGVILLLIFVGIAIAIKPTITDAFYDDLKVYQQALKIKNDPIQFQYAIDTNVGNVLAEGELLSLNQQEIPELKGKFAIIEKIAEKYTQHSETYCASRDEDGNCTSWQTRHWKQWDYYGERSWKSNTYSFIGYGFTKEQLELDAIYGLSLNKDTVTDSYLDNVGSNFLYEQKRFFALLGDIRYYYKYLPIKVNAIIPFRFMNEKITAIDGKREKNITVYINSTTEELIQRKKEESTIFTVFYYIFLVCIFGASFLVIANKCNII